MFCHQCGISLPPDSSFCRKCGSKIEPISQLQQEPSHSKDKRQTSGFSWRILGRFAIVVAFLVLVYASFSSKSSSTSDAAQAPPNQADASPSPDQPSTNDVSPAPVAPVAMPEDERQFIRVVQESRAAFQRAPNEMAQGGTRAQRREEICKILVGSRISGWSGQIRKLGSNNDGKGVLELRLSDGLSLVTWNNDFSDLSDGTLIDPSSPLFQGLSHMKVGDNVSFSGSFLPSDVDCVREASMSLSGSMTDPDFIFRFNTVSRQ